MKLALSQEVSGALLEEPYFCLFIHIKEILCSSDKSILQKIKADKIGHKIDCSFY